LTATENKFEKITVLAPLKVEKASLSKAAASLGLPPEEDRQPDLQYLTAIFVSSGMNKNGAVFFGSELCKARKSIANKAVDIEHDERMVIGQIMDCVYLDRAGEILDADKLLKEMSANQMDMMDMDIAISAIVHKARFPEIAMDILNGEWMVSMEAYYRDYDVKVGDLVIPRDQASQLGYDKLVGSVVHLKDGDKELGYHLVGRVLRDITFCGVGIVKNPANERSVILEAAALNDFVNSNKEHASVINLADITTIEKEPNVPTENIADVVRKVIREEIEKAGMPYNEMRPGTCVHYKKQVVNYPAPSTEEPATDLSQYPLYSLPGGIDSNPPGSTVVKEHHCNLFDIECSARPGNATAPECWRNVFASTVKDELADYETVVRKIREGQQSLVSLQHLLDEARKFRQ
jgi:hypothetical protein